MTTRISCASCIAGVYAEKQREFYESTKAALMNHEAHITATIENERQQLTQLMLGPCSEERDQKAAKLMKNLELAMQETDRIDQFRRRMDVHYALIRSDGCILEPNDEALLLFFELMEEARTSDQRDAREAILPAALELRQAVARSAASVMNPREDVLPEQVACCHARG